MSADHLSLEETTYKEYRTAKKNLKKGRDFADWMKIARGYDQARREAMHRAGANAPQGAAYREAFAGIDRREKLIDRDDKGNEFPSKEDRTYCGKLIENYDVPSHDPRRQSIKAWRDGLSPSERAKLNHPKRVWTAYWTDTEPRAERDAKRIERERRQATKSDDPMLDALGDAETREHDANRRTETARELLVYIRDHVDLPEDIVSKIEAVLRE
jgi:hypothetical protein